MSRVSVHCSPAPRPVDLDVAYASNEQDLIAALLNNCPNEDLVDRLLGCAYGQALGDAYGLSTEFENRQRVAHNYPDRTKLIPFPDYKLTAHSSRWTRGDWTDDTDQWILILETILEANGDVRVFAGKLKTWIERGFPDLGDQGGMGLGANVGQVCMTRVRCRRSEDRQTARFRSFSIPSTWRIHSRLVD